MSTARPTAVAPAAFSRAGALAVIAVGAAIFVALIWLIGAGAEFGGGGRNGQAHAAANGLNGYAGLVDLVEAEGYDITRSRSPTGLETSDLLVLTPPPSMDPKEFGKLLQSRARLGPTLVILPKWDTYAPPRELPEEVRGKFKRGWVILGGTFAVEWTDDLPVPFTLKHARAAVPKDRKPTWGGLGLSGAMPTRQTLFAAPNPAHRPLIIDALGRALAVKVEATTDSRSDDYGYPTIFVADADLMNNYGLGDTSRAAAAVALVDDLTYADDITAVTFDLTQNGFGGQENLLTLAFRPPFLAATLCLLLALLIIGWRAFQRFGPPATASGPEIAFGKQRLIANGAGLILRARRFRLLAAPYAALSARRMADRLGLARADAAAIDAAMARRLPQEEPFSRRAARLEAATNPADILTAAQAIDDLTTKLSQRH